MATKETTTETETCGICEGTRWIRAGEDSTKLILCDCQTEQELRNKQLIAVEASNMSISDLKHYNFENFKPTLQKAAKARADAKMLLKLCKDWVVYKPTEFAPKFLTIIGGVGIGKTHLSKASLAAVIQHWSKGAYKPYRLAYYAPATEIYRQAHNFENNAAIRYQDKLSDVEFLALDDVGVEWDPRGYMQTFYHAIIDNRYSNQRATLLTTNLSSNGKRKDSLLQRLGERIVSRLSDKKQSVLYEATGQDMRRY